MPRFFFRENGLWTALVGLAVVAGCANPVPPSGGPRDQTPPRIATSRPAAEATDVSRGRTVRIAFSEYVDRESLREALTVTPTPGGRLTFDWSRRSVEITFPERFRDNTTYLLTIDKTLTDLRNVELEQPITLAFSTGAQIDQGRLAGRVVGNRRGQGREGVDVYAYPAAAADSVRLPGAPLYRTQTGPEGTFQFEYLSEKQRYYVVALRDRNRNYRGGPLEAFAVPPRPALEARRGDSTAAAAPTAAAISALPDSAARDTVSQSALVQDAGARDRAAPAGGGEERTNERSGEAPWIIGKRDRVPPRLTGALPISSRRVALRFSEPVRLRARQARRVALTDTTAAEGGEDASAVAVRTLYRRPDQEQRLALRTDSMRPAGHRVRLVPPGEEAPDDSLGRGRGAPVAVDTSGNTPERPAEATFTAADRPDTLKLRFRGFRKSGPPLPTTSGDGRALALAPGQAPAVQFNQPPAVGISSVSDTAAAAALVTARDTATGAVLPFRLDTDDGTTYRLAFDPPLAPDQVARLRVNARSFRAPLDTAYARLARRLPSDVLGGVSGAVSVTRDSAVTDSVMGDSVAAAVLVELYAAGEEGSAGAGSEPLRTTRVDSSGGFVFRGLPEAPYRFRAFLDRDGDGEWDVGRLAPYRRAEPLAWSRRPVEARPRWETATEDTLRIRASRSAEGE